MIILFPCGPLVTARLFERIRDIPSLTTYDEELARKRAEKERQLQSVIDSIAQIPIQQANIAEQIGKTSNENVRNILLTQIETLEGEHRKLLAIKAEMEAENAMSLRTLDEELKDLELYWDEYPMQKRVALINFLVQKVVVDMMSRHWLRVQIHWLHEEWGVEQLFYCRESYGTRRWKAQAVVFGPTPSRRFNHDAPSSTGKSRRKSRLSSPRSSVIWRIIA
jgi:hypothetical protein